MDAVISFCLLAAFFFLLFQYCSLWFSWLWGEVFSRTSCQEHLPVSCFGHQSVAAISTAVSICKSNNSRATKHHFPLRLVLVEKNILWKANLFLFFFFSILAIKTHGAAWNRAAHKSSAPQPVNMGNHQLQLLQLTPSIFLKAPDNPGLLVMQTTWELHSPWQGKRRGKWLS